MQVVLTLLALSGGQGKTTISVLLARMLSRQGIKTLIIDADPQASATAFLNIKLRDTRSSLYEILCHEEYPAEKSLIPVIGEGYLGNLFAIASDKMLEKANFVLMESGRSLYVLQQKLQEIKKIFQVIIIDAPPQRSQIALTSLGAADYVLIPVEATTKGILSLEATLELINQQKPYLSQLSVLGIIPFRAKWVGNNPTKDTAVSMELMQIIKDRLLPRAHTSLIFPPVLESELFKKSMNKGCLPSDLGGAKVEYPLSQVMQALLLLLNNQVTKIPNK